MSSILYIVIFIAGLEMNLEEIRERLKRERMIDVCAAVGITRQALWLIKAGKTQNPSARVLDALRDYLGKPCN